MKIITGFYEQRRAPLIATISLTWQFEKHFYLSALPRCDSQMEDLRPALQQAMEQWDRFERALRDASVHTTRVRCSLHHPPLFSLHQTEGHMDILEVRRGKTKVRKCTCFKRCHGCCSGDRKRVLFSSHKLLKEEARKGEELWASADESYKSLARIVHHGSAQRLVERLERERKWLGTQTIRKKMNNSLVSQTLFFLKAHFVQYSDA